MISTLFSNGNEGAPDIEDTCAMVGCGLTPPVKRPDLKYAPLPSYLRGGVYTPPPYPYTMKEGATGKKVGGGKGEVRPGIMVSKKNR